METIKYLVPSVNCMHCAHTIKMELGDLDGVESVAVDVEKKEVRLEYSTPATTKSIETLLAEINYPVEKTL